MLVTGTHRVLVNGIPPEALSTTGFLFFLLFVIAFLFCFAFVFVLPWVCVGGGEFSRCNCLHVNTLNT